MPAVRLVSSLFLLAAITTTSSPGYAQQPRGALAGVVRDTAGRPMPLVLVSVALEPPHSALTDSSGRFFLGDVPPGLHGVTFRRIGYEPARFSLLVEAGDTARAIVELNAVSVPLDTIRVSAPEVVRELEMVGFYDRLREARDGAGAGRFITPEEMDQLRTMPKTTHIVETAGVRLLQSEGGLILWPVGRGNMVLDGSMGRLLTGPCQMTVFIDGFEVDIGVYHGRPAGGRSNQSHSTGPGLDAVVHPADIVAIEVYTSASRTPVQFQSTRNAMCGSIVIWTKAGPRGRPAR